MAKSSRTAADRADAAALKHERMQDGKLARRDYDLNQSAFLANMQRLRALRLSRDGEPVPVTEPKPPVAKKKRDKK